MTAVRPPAVAGLFYPDQPEILRAEVERLLDHARDSSAAPAARTVALIAPHAGYVYSGPVAARVYEPLRALKEKIRRVILLGPSHRVPLSGLALGRWLHFRTPLGDIPVCQDSVKKILALPQVVVNDGAHAREHSLEVHLPFLQTVFGRFKLVPLVTGEAAPEEISEVLETLSPDAATLIVISSDLSHYHDYKTAQKMDAAASRAILDLAPDSLQREQACGRHSIKGLLLYARRHDLKPRLIDLRNSGDTAGGRDRVVGYGSYSFEREAAAASP